MSALEDDLNRIADQAGATVPGRRERVLPAGDPFNPPEAEVAVSVGRMPWERRQLCRELATGEHTHAALGKRYGVTRQAITAFAKRHAREIDDIKANLDNEFAGLWVAQKANRIAAMQADLEASAGGAYGSHYEQIRTRVQIYRSIAEELGQLPPRATIAVVPVQHIIEGTDLEALK